MARSSAEVNMDNGWYGWWCHKCQNAAMRNNKSLLTKLYILHDIMYSNIPVNQDKWHYFHGNCNKSSDEFLLILFWQWFRCILCKEKMHKKNLQIPEWVWPSVLWFVTRLLLVLLVLRWLDIAMSLTSLKAVRPLWNNEVALGRKQTFCQRCIFQPPKYKEYK